MPVNDFLTRIASFATATAMNNPEAVRVLTTVTQFVAFVTPVVLHELHVDLGRVEEPPLEALSATVEQLAAVGHVAEVPVAEPKSTVIGGPEVNQAPPPPPTAPENPAPPTITEQAPPPPPVVPDKPEPPTSVLIGGTELEAEINQIKIENLRADHEKALSGLKEEQKTAVHAEATKNDTFAKQYFEGHPNQTPEDRTRDEQKFQGAKELNCKDVDAKYETKITDLKATQAVEMSTLTQTPAPPPPPAPTRTI